MENHILEAFKWLLGQFGIEPNRFLARVARAPLGLHLLDKDVLHPNIQKSGPALDQRPDLCSVSPIFNFQ